MRIRIHGGHFDADPDPKHWQRLRIKLGDEEGDGRGGFSDHLEGLLVACR